MRQLYLYGMVEHFFKRDNISLKIDKIITITIFFHKKFIENFSSHRYSTILFTLFGRSPSPATPDTLNTKPTPPSEITKKRIIHVINKKGAEGLSLFIRIINIVYY